MDDDHLEDPAMRRALVAWSDERRADWDAAVADRDPVRLRELYEDLGRFLLEQAGDAGRADVVLSRPLTNWIIDRIAQEAVPNRVLDLGCGPTPVAAMAFARAGSGVVAADVAHSITRLALDRAGSAGDVRGVVADAGRLPFARGAFDMVACDDTIEHVVDPAEALREIARVTRPGGRLLLISPNHGAAHVVVTRVREALRGRRHPRRWYFVHDSHVVEFRWRELRRVLGPRWRLERAYPVGWEDQPIGRKGRLMSRMVRVGPLWRLSSALVLLLRRTPSP